MKTDLIKCLVGTVKIPQLASHRYNLTSDNLQTEKSSTTTTSAAKKVSLKYRVPQRSAWVY